MPYRKTIQEIETACQSDLHKGLSEEEAQRRQKEQGKNILNKKKKVTLLQMFLEQFQDPMVIILIIGAIVSIFLKEYMDACIILVVIVLNAIIGVIQEFKAEKAIDALEKLSEPKAYVLRDGYLKEINSEDLVVGDIVELEAGRYIPADMRLLTSTNLKVEESTLTGESEAIEKQADIVYPDEMHIADQRNMVFMSTYVTYGKAQGMVVRCGMDSEVGKIARMLDETKEDMTPLQQRLAHLSKILGMLSLGVCAAMFVVAILQGRNLFDMLLLSISLAVAAIPEGLPAVVTIVLALGVQVMSKQNAIVRKLHAVETLGSVSVICSDKTGTLTQNKMHVVSSYANGMLQEVNEELLKGMVLCNDASISQNEVLGEPTETALLCFGEKQGFHKKDLDMKYVRVNEIPFDSNRKRMTTIHQHEREVVAYTKGALEKILAMCTSVWQDGKAVRMSNYEKQRILEASRQVSEDAQRVLALARKTLKSPYEDDVENKMCFIGFVGLMDPPREEVKDAIARCYKAGIRVAMITGDHPLTALAIARRLGIAKQETEVITGNQLDAMSDEELCASVKGYRVFARVTPQHKVRIVQAFKQNDMVVAMGGDGVNDAPSLKQADIGIAMGQGGTDVCKQASDMILADDNFATIVKAVEEGRGIYENIQKAILYLLSCNLGEIMSLFLAIICMPHVVSTLSAIQILWVNLITDAFPALALGVDPMEWDIMEQQPRNAKESLFAHGGWMFTILNGMFIGTITLVAFRYGLNSSPAKAQTMAFMVLSLSQLFHAFNLRSRTHSIFVVGLFKNKWLILTFLFSTALQIAVCQLPIFNFILKTVPLDMMSWGLVFGLSASVILINEASKWFAKDK
ncbi:calcium-translocating P-type ATPase, SERCA-type [Erysipelotrichaceae bacterium AM07-12]|uniref:calcium-translocating P-type ATPase, SERCA-type n=1 Tax=Longicatena caecimuris TaxID=1796635 RepID=UPI000E42A84D|nr:calcium-translocating P-type ATPase, SERCA-type [Longicatena caecimuris]RGD44116.1 calcium-translocating P-type ATPase, SERCA-type [Erysipelotrichaceae bacterium AM07-12]RGD46879.1 calcium-translocating P-type ATPase, SERCA-type [Erysipelotrichaceae bacterium AM07-35-1]